MDADLFSSSLIFFSYKRGANVANVFELIKWYLKKVRKSVKSESPEDFSNAEGADGYTVGLESSKIIQNFALFYHFQPF